ncbi:hypothetical protein NQ109_28575 [Priestia megaterium]|uniref:hypothetical protein n=1 Tax=Priestia megaterium TaxID=1404 RepID=UPI00215AF342|nr:hypothetical protein [Priestia megaterium]MCR8866885.1 hypothetical protein [Priestia megaterium]
MKRYKRIIKGKRLLYIILIILFVSFPFLTNYLVEVINFEHDSEWIGFFGNYFGSIVGVLGILLTIQFTTREENENRRLQVIPYIEVTYSPDLLIDSYTTFSFDCKKEPGQFYKGQLKFKNIGLGAAVDLELGHLNYNYGQISNNLSITLTNVMRQEEEVAINTALKVHKREWDGKDEEEALEYPKEEIIELTLTYKDFLNNTYCHNIRLIVHFDINWFGDKPRPTIVSNIKLDNQNKPRLI